MSFAHLKRVLHYPATSFDVYGSMDRPSPSITAEGLLRHYQRSMKWKEVAANHNCSFIPAVTPGYNDRGVRPEKNLGPLSRQLSGNPSPGSLFQASLQYSRGLVEPRTGRLLMVNSFNEWHEDTQIEPVQGVSTTLPTEMTLGIQYDGYGELYLNLLRQETAPSNIFNVH
jgi:glycoprotein endo-alpha-1,2-mannosidase